MCEFDTQLLVSEVSLLCCTPESHLKCFEVMAHLTDINLMFDDLSKNFVRMAKAQHDCLDPACVLME